MAPFGVTAITVLPLWVRPLAAVTLIRSVPELPRLTATVPSTSESVEVLRVPTVVVDAGATVVPADVVIAEAVPVPVAQASRMSLTTFSEVVVVLAAVLVALVHSAAPT